MISVIPERHTPSRACIEGCSLILDGLRGFDFLRQAVLTAYRLRPFPNESSPSPYPWYRYAPVKGIASEIELHASDFPSADLISIHRRGSGDIGTV